MQPEQVTVKCIKCEKDIQCEILGENKEISCPDGAGYIDLYFGWASTLDHPILRPELRGGTEPSHASDEAEIKLSKCDVVKGFFCDECFRKSHHLFQGYTTEIVGATKKFNQVW